AGEAEPDDVAIGDVARWSCFIMRVVVAAVVMIMMIVPAMAVMRARAKRPEEPERQENDEAAGERPQPRLGLLDDVLVAEQKTENREHPYHDRVAGRRRQAKECGLAGVAANRDDVGGH